MSHGHSIHFLSRLERLELPEVELALYLYRDVELLRRVLGWARIPEGHERVAIGLRREEGGPHLLVTRGGAFVTCLGPGMKCREVPIITRARFDELVANSETARERMAMASALLEPGEKTRDLIGRVFRSGHRLSREEYLAISGFAPMLSGHFVQRFGETCLAAKREWRGLARDMVRLGPKRLGRKSEAFVAFWDRLWAVGHLAALLSQDIRAVEDQLVEACGEPFPRLTLLPIELGFLPTAVRALLLARGLGPRALAQYVELHQTGRHPLDYLEAAGALVALGIGHEELCEEVVARLGAPPGLDPPELFGVKDWRKALPPALQGMTRFPLLMLEKQSELGDPQWETLAAKLAPDSRWAAGRLADDEARMLRVVAACNEPEKLEDRIVPYFFGAAAVGLGSPEELYFPRELLLELEATRGEDWVVERVVHLVGRYRARYRERPDRVEHPAAPNDRCPCGSGKKFKRCCMQAAAAPDRSCA